MQAVTVGANQTITVGASSNDQRRAPLSRRTSAPSSRSMSARTNRSPSARTRAPRRAANVTMSAGSNFGASAGADFAGRGEGEDGSRCRERISRSTAAPRAALTIKDELTISCGSASIILKKDGTIEIKGKDITIDGGEINVKATETSS